MDVEADFQGRKVVLTRQENRRKRNRRQKRRDRRKALRKWGRRAALSLGLVVVAVGLPFLILTAYSYTMNSEYFALSYIDVEGLQFLEEEALLEAAEEVAGEHLFNVRPERLEATMRTLPFVAEVEVERRFPDRLYISITEYEPVAIVVDDGFWLVDVHGEIFLSLHASSLEEELWKLPLITGLTRADLREEKGRDELHVALNVHRYYQEMGLAEKHSVSEIHVDELIGISLIVGEMGTEVRLGWGRWKERLERLEVVQDSLIRRGVDPAYVLIDQEHDLSRVVVGRRTKPGNGEVVESEF